MSLVKNGRLIDMQLEEIIGNLEKEELLIIKDYMVQDNNEEEALQKIIELNQEELLSSAIVAKILGYGNFDNYDEVGVYTKGYRILNKIPRMPSNIVDNLVKTFKSFQHLLIADIPELDAVEGIGEIRARTIKQALQRMQEQFVFDRMLI